MANLFVDTNLATGSNDGTSTDDAWQSIETAIESATVAAGDIIWVKRDSSFTGATSNIEPVSDGSLDAWIQVVAWPRAELTFTATFTNGSTTVSSVSGITADWEQHVGRRIKNDADGKWYLITDVSGSDFIIDREYASTTAATGNCTIEKDEHYDEAQAIDDSAWTIKLSTWTDDADDLPIVNFEATGYYLIHNGDYMWRYVGINFKNGTNSYGQVYIGSSSHIAFKYCLFEQTNNGACFGAVSYSTRSFFNQCIFKGNATGGSQKAGYMSNGGSVYLTDCAVYNMGGYGLDSGGGVLTCDNVNFGVEAANGGYAFTNGAYDQFWKDVKFSGSECSDGQSYRGQTFLENYNKVLNQSKSYNNNGTYIKTDVVAGSGDPEKRTGGADSVIAIVQNQSAGSSGSLFPETMLKVFEHRFWADTTIKSYRYYVQADDLAVADASEFYIECEYIDSYDDTSEYHQSKVVSDETILIRTGADDWSQYIEVTGIQPAIAGWVTIRCYTGFYDSDGTLYIDPLCVVS